MTYLPAGQPSVADILATAPPVRVEPGARERIRASHHRTGRRIAVLDDDPTGSQTVHDVSVVTVFDDAEYAAGWDAAGSTCFILTNTRSLPEFAAVELNTRVAGSLFRLGARLGAPIDVISRGDSTLRGHVVAEIRAIDAARRAVMGSGYDGVLLIPAYFEAGRFTAGDIHWATVAGAPMPVGTSEFARDATFGYTSSNLREFVAEKSGGTITAAEVRSISLEDIRLGGPGRVTEILEGVNAGGFVVVNATDYADLEIVAVGVLDAEDRGRSFVCRAGPSFPRALAGLEPRNPLGPHELWPDGNPGGHGLVVVGSHVGLTSRQVAAARKRGGMSEIELEVPTLTDPDRRDAYVAGTGRRVAAALASSDVLLFTSRTLVRGADADGSLAVARNVSAAVIDVVRHALGAKPSWVVAKGGITSHDVAVRGLGIRRAEVIGQLLPGMISVFRPVEAAPEAVGMPYVVFAGNVGDENTLGDVIDLVRGTRS
jgi:uncharacterized protein YgbK (DUF1537 family)